MENDSKTSRSEDTESKILAAAKKIFTRKGFHGARMQEIADEADINKAMLHYYYRSKEKLYAVVFENSFRELLGIMKDIFVGDMRLEDKIRLFVERYITFQLENPYLAQFIINEINQNTDKIEKIFSEGGFDTVPFFFTKELQEYIDMGVLRPMDPRHFVMNMLALCLFPFISKPLVMNRLGVSDDEFTSLMKERIAILPDIILNGVLRR